jgi:hypothetical protein
MAESWDPKTRSTVQRIPLLTVKAGPRDKEEWQKRLKEVRSLRADLCLFLLVCSAGSVSPAMTNTSPSPLPQELQALIKYIEMSKATDMDWFTIKPTNKEGTHWEGKCWYIHELIKYEFNFQVSGMPVSGEATAQRPRPRPRRRPRPRPRPRLPRSKHHRQSSSPPPRSLISPPRTPPRPPRSSCRSWRARRPRCTAAARSA